MRIARCNFATPLLAIAAATWLGASSSLALNVTLDFAPSMFNSDPTARAAIEQAATDISTAITSSLSPIDERQWSRSNTTAGQTLDSIYTWNFSFTLPGNPNSVTIVPSLAANEVRMFVRGENIAGSTLGTGGAAGIGFESDYDARFSGSVDNVVLQSQFDDLVSQHSALAQAEFTRGAGPVIRTASDAIEINFPNAPPNPNATSTYSVSYGPAYGTLALNNDSNWHFDHTTSVGSGKNDLYSVALHEMLHALGVGSSETWNGWVQGTSWNGPEAIAEHGTGAGLVQVGGSHIFPNVMSQSIVDGAAQEAAMDPTLTAGKRKYLTTLDLAFLRDLGYSTITPNFTTPGDFNGDGMVDGGDLSLLLGNWGTSVPPVPNNWDGSQPVGPLIDAGELSELLGNWGTGIGAASLAGANVPEPSAAVLLAGLISAAAAARMQRIALVCKKAARR